MKKNKLYLFLFAYAIWLMPTAFGQGYIVNNGVTYSGLSQGFGYEIQIVRDVSTLDYTRFFLNPIGKTSPAFYTNTFSFSEFLDVGVRVFLVSPNDEISLQPILSQSWVELGYAPSYVFQSGVPFYVALYTGYNFAPPYPPFPPYQYTAPVFGWAQLVNNRGVIQLLDSALEYGGVGIIAGTQTIIQPTPEPSSLALVALGGLLLGFRRWNQ
jgi:hypothetical protein